MEGLRKSGHIPFHTFETLHMRNLDLLFVRHLFYLPTFSKIIFSKAVASIADIQCRFKRQQYGESEKTQACPVSLVSILALGTFCSTFLACIEEVGCFLSTHCSGTKHLGYQIPN